MSRWPHFLMAAMIQIAAIAAPFCVDASPTSPDPLLSSELDRNLPLVEFETTQGTITLQLMPYAAPKACENFLKLVEKGYYDNTLFHRIIPGFMVQGGDPTGTGRGGESIWEKAFEDEFFEGLSFDRPGLLAMANAGPNSNGSQFFITVAATPWLNKRHTIFGIVVQGYEHVTALARKGTPSGRPQSEQKVIKARVVFMPETTTQSESTATIPY